MRATLPPARPGPAPGPLDFALFNLLGTPDDTPSPARAMELLSLGAHPFARDPRSFEDGFGIGATPLIQAAMNGQPDIVAILLPLSDPHAVDLMFGNDALKFSMGIFGADGSAEAIFDMLLPHADLEARASCSGYTGLMFMILAWHRQPNLSAEHPYLSRLAQIARASPPGPLSLRDESALSMAWSLFQGALPGCSSMPDALLRLREIIAEMMTREPREAPASQGRTFEEILRQSLANPIERPHAIHLLSQWTAQDEAALLGAHLPTPPLPDPGAGPARL